MWNLRGALARIPSWICSSRSPTHASLYRPISCMTQLRSVARMSMPNDSGNKKKGKKGRKKPERDPKLRGLLGGLRAAHKTRPTLRMGRNRYLRHWTIHRAWLLFRRQQRQQREGELKRQYQSMHNACEELRQTAGPGNKDLGYLYRVAMEKRGVYGHHGIPIEYARAQTETPAREAWNHAWKL